jgi:hypothetical protein
VSNDREPFSHDADAAIREQREDERKAMIVAYGSVFAGSQGERVLADLERLFGFNRPSAAAGMRSEDVWMREGMKQPFYHIRSRLELFKRGGKPADHKKPKRATTSPGPKRSNEVVPQIPPERQ